MRLSFRDNLTIHDAAPFTGQGVSLYVTLGSSVQYRDQRIECGMSLGADADVAKTTRIDSVASPATNITFPVDPAWVGQTISVDIRTYKDNVENGSTDFRTITLDGSGDEVPAILGTATLLDSEQRDGGIVRIRFAWQPALDGLQPDTFTAIRTAGPTSPANAAYTVTTTGRQVIAIDTPALSDASAYTYKIQAASGATTLDVLTGISVTADATGPTAPTAVAVEW
jgi:hypothetical protein